MIFKCKICGGALDVKDGETVLTCEFCGTKQTLPRLDNDRKANLYDRANHFRRNNDYDKAMAIYEQILAEDATDAESYWSLVLCKFGIEYVEDSKTRKRVPTINRMQSTSVFADEDYRSALKYADGAQKEIYQVEAREIDRLQKDILAISNKEKPFDVFICYKESDENGKRTADSVIANDIYHQLTQEGYKVFYAAITLEDKLGTAYEPYIFAALNSSKVMVVIGTKSQYFNAVWVKNEWARYLALIKNGDNKVLIPAYKDMDPYDLPEEFSHLQAQDMSKIGFMQDLIRGIKKVINAEKPKAKDSFVEVGGANVSALLERAKVSLEDGEFENADAFCEKVLDIDAKNSTAYLYKLMANLQVCEYEDLKDLAEPFSNDPNLAKIERYDEKLGKELNSICTHISARNVEKSMEEWYVSAKELLDLSTTSAQLEKALSFLEYPPAQGYKDVDKLIVQCKDRLEQAKLQEIEDEKQANYIKAATYLNKGDKEELQQAIVIFHNLNGYKDSEERLLKAKEKIKAINAEEQKKAKEAAEKKRIADERAKKKKIVIASIIAGIIAIIITIVVISTSIANADLRARGYCVLQKEGNSYAVVGFEDNTPSEIVIPKEYKGLPVTKIGKEAFHGCYRLTSIIIPDSVTSIGEEAFVFCHYLKSVKIGSGVTSIEKWAFWYCDGLESVVFANTRGWKAGQQTLSSSELSNQSTAAKYLRGNYHNYTWTRG